MARLLERASAHAGALLMTCAVVLVSQPAAAQPTTARLRVHVQAGGSPVSGAAVVVNGVLHVTAPDGLVVVPVASGTVEVQVSHEGFVSASASLNLAADQEQELSVELEAEPRVGEEVTVIASTRTSRGLVEQPLRVDVLPREEIEEKMLMTPGDIVMMMNEMGGMRVQATSPSLAAASVRIQGMRGRYTRVLADGLPLFGDVGGLGLLQIPPMDLGQVEVIKGVASSLYGAGAMGGVVNLISRRPGRTPVREFLVNQSTRGGTDGIGFYAAPLSEQWGLTVLGGGHWQQRIDVNGDGWSDLPFYARGVFRPRVFWSNGSGATLFATTGITVEDREGGTPGTPLVNGGEPYAEALDTRRLDVGLVAQLPVRDRYLLTARLAASRQEHTHVFGDVLERDRHRSAYGELTLRGTAGPHAWAAGVALDQQTYDPRDVPQFAHRFTIPGAFAQDDVEVARWLSVSASARVDRHNRYGTFVSPRFAALVRAGRWNSRLSAGTGFVGPSALTEETEASGLTRLTVPNPLRAELGRSASLDVTRTYGPFTTTVTFFASRVRQPIDVSRTTAFVLTNADESTTTTGAELLVTYRREPLAVTTTYTYVRARELDEGTRADVPLTPGHSVGLVAFWEREVTGRFGAEAYYTGAQRLEANPYATRSEPYVLIGLLAERRFGPWRVFVNGENLTGVRQTNWQPVVRQERAADGRWTVDAWAPLEGRNINGGVRVAF